MPENWAGLNESFHYRVELVRELWIFGTNSHLDPQNNPLNGGRPPRHRRSLLKYVNWSCWSRKVRDRNFEWLTYPCFLEATMGNFPPMCMQHAVKYAKWICRWRQNGSQSSNKCDRGRNLGILPKEALGSAPFACAPLGPSTVRWLVEKEMNFPVSPSLLLQ